MAWEKRGNRIYFYRKERINGRVQSRYTGSGEVAVLIEQCRKGRRLERKILEAQERERREEAEFIDRQINELSEINRNLVDALFLINGYRLHERGEWRRKRDEKTG